MAKKMKISCVAFEGIDRCGKSTLVKYLGKLCGHVLTILDRGPLTNMVWNKMQGRDIEYDIEPWKSTIFVHLSVDKPDWEIRCKLTNEPPLDYEKHTKAYDEMFDWFKDNGFYVLEFNTSKMTHYRIAKKVMDYINELNSSQS